MNETPMQGLAQWLREVAASPATSNAHWLNLIRWASEVEAARARPQMPKPRDFAEVARDVEAARASLPAPDEEWLKEAEALIARLDGYLTSPEQVRLGDALLAHLRARHSADNASPKPNEKESDTALLRQCLQALEIHHDWCANLQSDYSEVGGDRVAYRATSATLAKLRERLS